MKLHRLLPIAALALLAGVCLYTYRLEVPEFHDWPATGITDIDLETRNGTVEVAATTDTIISARVNKLCYGRNREDAEQAIENITITDTVAGARLQLRAEMPSGGRSYGASFRINSPASTGLALSTSNSTVTLSNMLGGANVQTSNAKINLIGTAGSARLSSSNGAVTVQVHDGPVEARTSNGVIDCDLTDLGPTESALLETSNGGVVLRIPADVSASFDLQTSNGGIQLTGFASVSYTLQERTHQTGQIGSGAATIRIRTSNGDVRILAR